MQLHVRPPADHVNNHEFCLHIWRPLDVDIPRPPSVMVGVQSLGIINRQEGPTCLYRLTLRPRRKINVGP
jgi:hypothetical protein